MQDGKVTIIDKQIVHCCAELVEAVQLSTTLTAYATYRLTARQDQRKWRAELAEKYARCLLRTQNRTGPRAAQALARSSPYVGRGSAPACGRSSPGSVDTLIGLILLCPFLR